MIVKNAPTGTEFWVDQESSDAPSSIDKPSPNESLLEVLAFVTFLRKSIRLTSEAFEQELNVMKHR